MKNDLEVSSEARIGPSGIEVFGVQEPDIAGLERRILHLESIVSTLRTHVQAIERKLALNGWRRLVNWLHSFLTNRETQGEVPWL